MNKIILEFDFLNGPIYKDVYDIKNNIVITGIKELDTNKKIMSLNQEMQEIYSSFYNTDKLSEDDSFDYDKIKIDIKKLYQKKIELINEIKLALPNIMIEDKTIDFFDKYLEKNYE